jgi:CHAT domain-containing protein
VASIRCRRSRIDEEILYKYPSGKITPAAALRAAQLEISKDQKYSNPYYWAGFTLQGEWK